MINISLYIDAIMYMAAECDHLCLVFEVVLDGISMVNLRLANKSNCNPQFHALDIEAPAKLCTQ